MQAPYEVLLDVAMTCLKEAADHPECPTYHERKLEQMCDELDSMYGAHISNMDPEVRRVRYGSGGAGETDQRPCPHMRPSWRMCPHCLGINS